MKKEVTERKMRKHTEYIEDNNGYDIGKLQQNQCETVIQYSGNIAHNTSLHLAIPARNCATVLFSLLILAHCQL